MASALEHAHNHTWCKWVKQLSSDGGKVMARAHVGLSPPKIVGPILPDCAKVPGEGGGPGDTFFVRCRVDK